MDFCATTTEPIDRRRRATLVTSTGQGVETASARGGAAHPKSEPPAKSNRRRISWLLATQLALGLIVAVANGMLVVRLREQAMTASTHELQSIALTLADQADRAFDGIVLLQTTFLEMTKDDSIETPDDFRRVMSSREINQKLIDHSSMLPQARTIALVDTKGMFINYNHAWPVPGNTIADRPYFMALKNDPNQTMVISDPIENRMNQGIAVVIAHRVTAASGVFLGISFAGVRMSDFEDLYRTVTNKEDTAIALTRKDGVLFARYPHIDATIGKSFKQGIVAHMAESGAKSAVIVQASQIDGVERLTAGHALSRFPLVVSVSTSVAAILRPWRQQAANLIGSAAIIELLIFGVGMLTQRQLRSQALLGKAHAAMAESETARRADQALHVQAVRFGAALGNMSEVLCLFDAADRLVVGNDRLASMLGIPAGSITPGMTIRDMGRLFVQPPGPARQDPPHIPSLIMRMRAGGRRESQALDMDDGRRIAVNFAPMADDGWLVTLEDITKQRRAEARIEHMAHHDALTGLANRVLFHIRLNEAMARCRTGERFAVLYLDLDHFKAVNDTLGHPAGDALLQAVTRRLKLQARETDVIARLGGDEFAVLQSIDRPADSAALAKRLIEAVCVPYEINGNKVVIGTSIGLTIVPDDANDVDEVIKNADLALYQSKSDGRGRYEFFATEMNARMRARRTLDLDLRRALADGEFRVFYQPLINIATRSVCGFEALARWQHPERGLLSPADFVPMAEETGLIVPLGNWVLRQACADASTWPGSLKVAVNLSPRQFGCQTLVEDVAAALADSKLRPARLELEITETAMLEDTDAVLATLHQLRDLGLGIALDDFGTGYSSLSYLQRFPFNKVKIDRSFVGKLGHGAGNTDTIVASVIELCGRLGMITTGEGVETPAQLHRLAALHCVEAQGYLFSRPCPASELTEILSRLAAPALEPIAQH